MLTSYLLNKLDCADALHTKAQAPIIANTSFFMDSNSSRFIHADCVQIARWLRRQSVYLDLNPLAGAGFFPTSSFGRTPWLQS